MSSSQSTILPDQSQAEPQAEPRTDSHSEKNRIHWQCRRGMLELDDMLQGFLARGFDELDSNERLQFENLLTCQDNLLLEYFMGRTIPADPDTAHVVNKIRAAAQAQP